MSELVNDNGVDRQATPEEVVEIAAERARATKEIEDGQQAKDEAKAAVLAKLGLTADEVAALIA
jgi:hypothetical protein